jgi:hypothetical protein
MANMFQSSQSWFGERAGEYVPDLVDSQSSFSALSDKPSFDQHYTELAKSYHEKFNIDIKRDIGPMVADRTFMENFRQDLFAPIFEGFADVSPNDYHIAHLKENVNRLWDAKVRNYSESASAAAFLPISTLEFPALAKQFYASITKDIIEVETVKTPSIMKHIRSNFLVDNQTGEMYEYPKCLWDGNWEKVYDAARGHKIKNDPVPLPITDYDIVANLTDGIPGQDKLSFNIGINAVRIGGDIIPLIGNGITIDMATGGTFVNGKIKVKNAAGTEFTDYIGGQVNFRDGKVDASSSSGGSVVDAVCFYGYLSNELNLNTVSVREFRDLQKFVIEDGPRWNMPFSIEEIEDHAALSDLNYYNRMVDEMVKTQEMIEGQTVIKFLDDEYNKHKGVATDIYKLESLVQSHEVDIQTPAGYAGDIFQYRANATQDAIANLIYRLQEAAKLDNLSFIIAGNPMATKLLNPFTEWKYTQGTSTGGITMNNSYGFMTNLSAPVRVVASNRYKAYTDGPASTGARELQLFIYCYPTDPEHISYKHLKYTNHLLTSQSQAAYQSLQAPGGAYTIVTGVSRYKDIAIQGIQARLILKNSSIIYGTLA